MKRTFPLVDGAISLSSVQFMHLNDVSQSVQLQLNNLRDGSATANNAVNSRFANSASLALYANSASFALIAATANSASYATLAGTATLALTANSSSFATNCTNATFATNAANASNANFAIQAGTAATANSASYAALAGLATTATTAINANAVGGFAAAVAATGNTVAARNASGYLFATYFNMGADVANPTVTELYVGVGDGYIYRATAGHAGSYIAGQNISGRTGTGKTLQSGSGPPSLAGSTNGDLFYYY